MKNLIKSAVLFFVLSLAYSPANAQVTYNADKSFDFTQFKTYSFGGWQEDSNKIVSDIDKKRIYTAFNSEFGARGMTFQDATADAVVTFYFVVDNKTSTTAYTSYNGGMGAGYGYGMGYARPGWGWGGGSSTTSYSENDYQVGTFVVDVYDTKTKKMVWQGVSKKTINQKANKREKSIPKGVKKLMKNYPVDILK